MITMLIKLALQAGLYALLAPGIVGLLDWLQARLQARRGSSPWQPYWDLIKLLQKQPNVAQSTSWLFPAVPPIVFACYLSLGLFLPLSFFGAPTILPLDAPSDSSGIDFILVVYLLGLARFVMGLAAFDAAAMFGAMSSGRQMSFHVLAEPTLLVTIFALTKVSRTTNLDKIILTMDSTNAHAIMFITLSLGLVFLAESGRLPFDNPHTHLELTMVERGTHLAYAGRSLALLEWGEAMKLTFFLFLLSDLIGPRTLVTVPVKLFLLLLALALWEVTQTKVRLRQVIGPFTIALVLALVAALSLVLGGAS